MGSAKGIGPRAKRAESESEDDRVEGGGAGEEAEG